ncbi:MAG: hypothetical protein ABII88_07670 [Candidatus Omnitrophota bacterium]
MKSKRLIHIFFLLIIISWFFVEISSAKSIFSGIQVQELRKITENDLVKDWFSIPVYRSEDMFNPVFLPFTYVCEEGIEDPNQSLTFPCLLSFKFDFVPDNFSARHPGFVFRSDPSVLKIDPKEAEEIAYYIKNWQATHVITGTIIQKDDDYRGELVVYDVNGVEILRQEYAISRPYFELMGEMVESWMDFRKQVISEKMAMELFRDMTTDMETVKWYGETFDVEWRSFDEWDIYERILERDPEFAEVRFWYANQKGWSTGEKTSNHFEYIRASESHIVIPAISYISYKTIKDQSLRERFKANLEKAREICGESPVIAETYLELGRNYFSTKELDEFLPLAEKYPNYKSFIDELADKYFYAEKYDKAAPLYLATLHSSYLPGEGLQGFSWAFIQLVRIYMELGYLSEAKECIELALVNYDYNNKPWLDYYSGVIYQELFDFKKAKGVLDVDKITVGVVNHMFFRAAMGAFILEDFDTMKKWENTPSMQSLLFGIRHFYKARKALLDNNPFTALLIMEDAPFRSMESDEIYRFEKESIKAEAFLVLKQKKKAVKSALRAWYLFPRSRKAGYLLEAVLDGKVQTWGRFLEVASFIFPSQHYWADKLSALKGQGYKTETDDWVLNAFYDLKKRFGEISSGAKIDFFISTPPFLIEYLCMRILQTEDSNHINDALDFYVNFAATISAFSRYQKTHTRIYLMQILSSASKEEKNKWSKKLEDLIEREFGKYERLEGDGWRYVDENMDDEALKVFEEVIKLFPEKAGGYHGVGYVYEKKGMSDEAIQMCEKAISISPDDSPPYIVMGNAYIDKKMEDEASEAFKKATQINPAQSRKWKKGGTTFKVFGKRGSGFLHSGELDKAIEEYEIALSINPTYSCIYHDLAAVYSLKKDKYNALRFLKMAFSLGVSDKCKEWVKTGKEFDFVRNDQEFQKIIQEE